MVLCQPITLHSCRALSWNSIIYLDEYNLFITQEYVILWAGIQKEPRDAMHIQEVAFPWLCHVGEIPPSLLEVISQCLWAGGEKSVSVEPQFA